ncbi:DNA-binding protein [Enterococcus asini]|uniref:DNA-binding protein n=1 Tax=Enterococcus asini TaxID=57732 RepID=UPI0028907544|nr:DNA-binding protein [Enterococcus asini]MDT2757843.1 DNA-binding protein [Enterococcus asini]
MIVDFLVVTLLFGIGIILVNLLVGLVNKGKRVKSLVILTVVELVLLGGFLYAVLPSKTLSSLLWYNLWGAFVAILLAFFVLGLGQSVQKARDLFPPKANRKQAKPVMDVKMGKLGKLFGGICTLMVILFLVSKISSITAIDEVYDSIPLKTEEKAEVLTSTKETPIAIAPDMAKRKMLQKFSVIPNSNMFTLDGITAQTINGEYVYVATVEYTGFFKWLKLGEVPGYFKISATDINAQPEFVKEPLVYTPSAYFGKDAARRIYAAFPGYASYGKINLEIDEAGIGIPHYVQTLYKEYGVSGLMHYDEFKTAVLNAQTGDVKLYDNAKAPKFVDAPITSAAANSMNEFFGRYSNGWWNQFIFGAKKDVKIPTDNGIYASGQITPMLSKEGQLNYFTDFTSGDDDQDSALGYSLIDARTGEVTYYRDPEVGIMDSDGAISIASKIYPEKKWQAEMPVLYNIDGVPTWIVSLMDTKGIFKEYVYINAVDNDIVVDAENAQSALDAYRIELATKGSNNQSSDASDLTKKTGIVERVVILPSSSSTVISFLLEEDKTVYSVNSNNSPFAIFMKEGDQVTFSAALTADTTVATIQDLTIDALTTEK